MFEYLRRLLVEAIKFIWPGLLATSLITIIWSGFDAKICRVNSVPSVVNLVVATAS
jgi:hypothetical protein